MRSAHTRSGSHGGRGAGLFSVAWIPFHARVFRALEEMRGNRRERDHDKAESHRPRSSAKESRMSEKASSLVAQAKQWATYYGKFTQGEESAALTAPLRARAAWDANDADAFAGVFTE